MDMDFHRLQKVFFLLVFFLSVLSLYWYYGLDSVYLGPPRSVHIWRQTDGASIALNYYQDGLPFFKPRMHNVLTGNGQSVGEFPLIYYLAACAYSLGGVHEGYFRWISLFFFLGGLYLFSLLLWRLSNHLLLALSGGLLLFCSPVNAFYAFNFLPDAPALGLALAGIYGFFRYSETGLRRFLWFGAMGFTLAGLLKITMLTCFVAFLLLWILGWKSIIRDKYLAMHHIKNIWLVLATVLLPVVAWYLWAQHYNRIHSSYLLMDIKPLWELDGETIRDTWQRFARKWRTDYFHDSVLIFLAAAIVLVAFSYKSIRPSLRWFLWLILAGVLANMLLWFGQLFHHDYYAIAWMILPATLLLCLAEMADRARLRWVRWVMTSVLLAVTLFSAQHTRHVLFHRYQPGNVYNSSINPALFQTRALQTYINSLGIRPNDKVISLPDASPNTSLYLMNLRGHTDFGFQGPYDAARIDSLMALGVHYLVIADAALLRDPALTPLLHRPLGAFENSIFFYRLGD